MCKNKKSVSKKQIKECHEAALKSLTDEELKAVTKFHKTFTALVFIEIMEFKSKK